MTRLRFVDDDTVFPIVGPHRSSVRSVRLSVRLFDLAERAPHVTATEHVARTFSGDPAISWVAVVDEHDRPVHLVDRRGATHPPLTVLPAERLADVTRRVASRPSRDRRVPLVLCDERGRLLGLVTVERLLDRLADTLDSPSCTT